MANINEFFDSKYLSAGDLMNREHRLTIERVGIAEFKEGAERKPAIYFVGKKKGMALNKTNAKKLAAQWGGEMNDWLGKEVIVYPDTTEFNGNTVECIRLRPVLPVAQADDGGDGIPF